MILEGIGLWPVPFLFAPAFNWGTGRVAHPLAGGSVRHQLSPFWSVQSGTVKPPATKTCQNTAGWPTRLLWGRRVTAHFPHNIDAEYRSLLISKGDVMPTSQKHIAASHTIRPFRLLYQLQFAQNSNSPSILTSRLKKGQNEPISEHLALCISRRTRGCCARTRLITWPPKRTHFQSVGPAGWPTRLRWVS